jgi:ABC-type multidrug transport system fused ATPase/permease subunit
MRPEFRKINGILLKNKKLLILTLGLGIFQTLLMIFIPYLSKIQIEILEGKGSPLSFQINSPQSLFIFILFVILITKIILTIIDGSGKIFETLTREKLSIDADKMLYEKMEQLDAGFLQNPNNRRLIYIFFDIGQLPWSFLIFIKSSINIMVSLMGIIPVMAFTNSKILAIVLLFGLLQFFILRARMKKENAFRLYKEKRFAKINELIFLLRYHFHELLGASGEKQVMPKFWTMRNEALDLEVSQERISIFYEILNHLVENITLFLTGIFLGYEAIAGNISIGLFSMVLMYATILQGAIGGINQNFGEWYRLRSVFIQLGFFLHMRPRISTTNSTVPPNDITGDITINNVEFSYPGLFTEEKEYIEHLVKVLNLTNQKREVWQTDYDLVNEWEKLKEEQERSQKVLKGISLTVKRGEITALVGRNGSGKTTLMKLLMRNYDPDQGNLKIDTENILNLKPKYIRHLFSMVSQSPFLLDSFSIRDNILLGCKTDDTIHKNQEFSFDNQIWELLEKLKLKKVIKQFPKGLDSLLGDEVSLSGGESQLLIIARAILQKRPYLIIDEGTNQLDAEKELEVLHLLNELKKESAIIIITHRMTTARKADSIAVLDNGIIVERGSHQELLKSKGLYEKFWRIQVVD